MEYQPVVAAGQDEAGDLLDLLQPVVDRLPVHVQRRRGFLNVAAGIEEGERRVAQIGVALFEQPTYGGVEHRTRQGTLGAAGKQPVDTEFRPGCDGSQRLDRLTDPRGQPGLVPARPRLDKARADAADPDDEVTARPGWQALGVQVHCLPRSEEHTSELQSRRDLVCRLLLEKKKKKKK